MAQSPADGRTDRNAIWDEALDWLLSVEGAPHDGAVQACLARWLARGRREQAAFARARRVWRLAGGLASSARD